MNISPVSFGRTIRVNAPLDVAKRMAELVNQSRLVNDSEERSAQQKLKTLFYDSNVGSAQVVQVNEQQYIVTGDTSLAVSDLKLDAAIHINCAKNAYGESEMYEMVKEEETKRCNEYLDLIIQTSEEPLSISTKYTDVPNGKEWDSVGTKIKIKSVNLII